MANVIREPDDIVCDVCWGTGEIQVLVDSSAVYNPEVEPIYETIPCDECGGHGERLNEAEN